MNRVLNKIKLYAAGFILAAFALVFTACSQPDGGGTHTDKAIGSTLTANPTAASTTSTSITLNAATLSTATGQEIEYARSSSTTLPTSGWQTIRIFTGLTANTQYYFHARSKENDNYTAGEARNAQLKTQAVGAPVQPVKIDFEADNVGKTYSVTGGNGSASAEVVTDPLNAGQKSLKIITSGYNRGVIIPVKLDHELGNWETLSFRINITSGTDLSDKSVMAYAAGSTSDFTAYGFGNPADSQYAQFANRLAGQTASVDFSASTYKDKWTSFTITLNPGSVISGLNNNFFIAFGINSQSATYLIDDLIFTIKPSFEPPPPPPPLPPAPNPPATGAVSSGTYRNMFKERGKSGEEITAKVNTTWDRLFTGDETYRVYNPVGTDMAYILDSGQDNPDVRSEGMSYGMMMAVQMDKQTEFDRLWRWAKQYMYNETNRGKNSRGYFAWQVKPNGDVLDYGPAPDGEFYFATALLFAHARWGSGSGVLNYRQHAMQLLYDMIHRDTAKGDNHNEPPMFRIDGSGQYMTTFQPQGNAANFTDPSYHLPAFYEVWAIELERDANDGNLHEIWSNSAAMMTDANFYKEAAKTSRAFFQKTTHATTGLGPDYAKFDGSPEGGGDHSTFYYDAFRIAMNVAMDYAWFASDPWQIIFANRIQTFFYGKGVTSYTALWTLDGTSRGGDHSPGLVACNAVASLAATHERAWEFLDDFWNIGMTEGKYRYYDGCLYMLGLLHVTGNFKAYLSGGGNYVPSSNIDPTTATFDKNTDYQQDITVNMTLNGNNLVNIKNGTANLTLGTDYTLSNNNTTVTLKKAYFAGRTNGTTTLTFVFSGGSDRTIVITVKETPPGGTPSGGTSFDFTSLSSVDVEYIIPSGSTITASIENGVLHVNKTGNYSSPVFILTFNLGSQNLSNFTGVKVKIRGTGGDTQNTKNLTIESVAANNNGTALTASTGFSLNGGAWNERTIPFTASTQTLSALTGAVRIAFGLNNTNPVDYEFEYIELYK